MRAPTQSPSVWFACCSTPSRGALLAHSRTGCRPQSVVRRPGLSTRMSPAQVRSRAYIDAGGAVGRRDITFVITAVIKWQTIIIERRRKRGEKRQEKEKHVRCGRRRSRDQSGSHCSTPSPRSSPCALAYRISGSVCSSSSRFVHAHVHRASKIPRIHQFSVLGAGWGQWSGGPTGAAGLSVENYLRYVELPQLFAIKSYPSLCTLFLI